MEYPFYPQGQFEISPGNPSSLMRGQIDPDLVIHIEPFRVMVALLSNKRYLGHKTKGLDKAFKTNSRCNLLLNKCQYLFSANFNDRH